MFERSIIKKDKGGAPRLSSRGIDFSKPRLMEASAFNQSGCWFCGAHDAKSFTDEYGWYEEMTCESGGANITFTNTTNTYIPIGECTVRICDYCIAGHHAVKNKQTSRVTLLLTVIGLIGALLSGFYYGFLDWLGDIWGFDALYFTLADVWHHENNNHILTQVFAVALSGISWLLLIPAIIMILAAFIGLVTWPFRGKAVQKRRDVTTVDGLTTDDRRALRDWARDLGAAQLMRENAKVDPFFFFHPDADDDGQRHIAFEGRSEWIREYGGMTFRHWIEHRTSNVDKWETKPMPSRKGEEERADLTRRGLKPPGGWL